MKKNLNLGLHAEKIINRLILISGTARSGTTIAGKIIGSCRKCEYFFEPETLLTLFPLINKINKHNWKLLFETYVVEDLLYNAIQGRKLNLRQDDDSYFFTTKTQKDYLKRQNSRYTRMFALQEMKKIRPVLKLPDIVIYLKKFQKYYPKVEIILCHRNQEEVTRSLHTKKWYKTNFLKNKVWPFFKYRSAEIPFWVQNNKKSIWEKLTELEKINHNICQNKPPKKLKYVEFNYNLLINNKKKILEFLRKNKLKASKQTIRNINIFRK